MSNLDLLPIDDDPDWNARDEAIFAARLGGETTRSLAKRFAVPAKYVTKVCVERLPRVDLESTQIAHREALAALEELHRTFFWKAIEQEDVPSALVVLKISERVAALRGLDSPRPVTPISLTLEAAKPNSTERLRAAFMRVINDRSGKPPANADPDDLPI